MQKHSKIYSVFFLIIFSMFILHQVLPHVNHEHERFEESIGLASGQHHSHDKDHHHDNEEGNDGFDFLGFLLGSHIHGSHVENTPAIKSAVKQQFSVTPVLLLALPAPQVFSIEITEIKTPGCSLGKPDFFYCTYLSPSLLRGPPFIG